jgi:hypothetical protein
MGRKTKKEKVLADLRRKIARMEVAPREAKPVPARELALPKKTVANPVSIPAQSNSLYIYPAQLIKKDLTKTILISILAIGLEVVMYFIFEGKISLPIKFSLPVNLNFG